MRSLKFLALAIVAVACTKTENIKRDISFTLTERGSGRTIGNMALQINGPTGTNTVVTNSVGKASLAIDWSAGTYTVRPLVDEVNFMYNLDDRSYFDPKNDIAVPVKVTPYGFLKIKLRNATPCDPNDIVILNGEWKYGTTQQSYKGDCSVNLLVERDGKTTFPVQGNDYCKIAWEVRNGSSSKSYLDSIKVNGHDTVTYNLNY